MGRRPKQESVKEFLHNKKPRFLFSDAAEYANIFPEGKTEMYLKPVPAGGRMKKVISTLSVTSLTPNPTTEKPSFNKRNKVASVAL